ncbi:transporter substrate-binding domain-containing protein [Kiloniella laminariae]|uniref:Transporter substrate-binding domain-containing protein n=1 Tax=Kiloniella laminariae TaxID=454162 RepID=A0ABT4LFP8_9PROT|nr:transporter substrate-binding domain-containing protein [Kiloniella laminariae]MCZ4279166.1 transporter substrate-binding domain-containing protein [Kiloniella laminariae]
MGFPPFTYLEKEVPDKPQRELTGASYELISLVFSEAGIPAKVELAPWKRCLASVARFSVEGDFEIFLDGSSNREREGLYLRTQPVYLATRAIYYSKKNLPRATQIPELAALNQYRLCGIAGYNLQWLRLYSVTQSVDQTTYSYDQAFHKLDEGRCDFVIGYKEQVEGLIKEGDLALPKDVEILKNMIFPTETFYLWISRNSERADHLLQIVNDGIALLQQDGRYEDIFLRYVKDEMLVR